MVAPAFRRQLPQGSLAGLISSLPGPRVFVGREARADGLDSFMDELSRARPLSRVPRTAALVKLVASLLSSGPHLELNARVEGGEALYFREVNVAVPVYEGGVVRAAVVLDAARRGLDEIAASIASPEASDLSDATFSLVNMGPFGVDWAVGLQVPGPVATLTVGRARPRQGEEGRTRYLTLTLSVDPRAVGPDVVGSFLADLAAALSSPDLLRRLLSG